MNLFIFMINKQEIYHNYDRDKTLISVDSPNQRFQKKELNNNGCTSPQASVKDKKVLLQRWYKQLKLCSEKVRVFFKF